MSFQGRSRRLEPGHRWDEYSPKTPLHEYMTIHVEQIETDRFSIASHGARLQMSKCYGSGKLGCATCHNPHSPSSKAEYISDCKGCHESGCDNRNTPKGTARSVICPKTRLPIFRTCSSLITTFESTKPVPLRRNVRRGLIDPHAALREQTEASRGLRLAVGYFDDMDAGGSQIQELSRDYVSTHLADAVEKHLRTGTAGMHSQIRLLQA